MKTVLLFFFALLCIASDAQTDTAAPVKVDYTTKVYKQGDVWKKEDRWISTGALAFDGSFADSALIMPTGIWSWYNKEQVLIMKKEFDKYQLKDHYVYFNNGKQKMHASFVNDSLTNVKGWDSLGNEIQGFIYQQPASFPGGLSKWRNYLIKAINTNTPKDFKKGNIEGVVQVSFIIDKDGNLTDVAVKRSSGYTELDEHALNVIRNSPKWIPGIQYNEKVKYRQIQPVVYKLVDK